MAKKKEKGLIGFDPLSWMENEALEKEPIETEVDVVVKKNKEVDVVIDSAEEFAAETMPVNDAVISKSIEESKDEIDDSKTVLDAILNIQNVSTLYEQLFKQLENKNKNKIEIDASAVTAIDTATLQMLIVLKQTAKKAQKEVEIDFPSDKFIEAAQLLGLSEVLGVDQAAAGLF